MNDLPRDFAQELREGNGFEVREPTSPNLEEIQITEQPWKNLVEHLRWRLMKCMVVIDHMEQDDRYELEKTLREKDKPLHDWLVHHSKLRRNNFIAIKHFLDPAVLAIDSLPGRRGAKIQLAVAMQRVITLIETTPDRTYRSNPLETNIALSERLDQLLLDVYTKLQTILTSGEATEPEEE